MLRTARRLACILVLCGALAAGGCTYSYDSADYEDGGDMIDAIGEDYAMTVILVPMLIGVALAASSE